MATCKATPVDLILFHRLEGDLYAHLVGPLSQNPEKTKWVLSLWIWFESIGHHDFIRHVAAHPDDIILQFVLEGKVCLQCLISPSAEADGKRCNRELSLISSLMADPMNQRFFNDHKELALMGVMGVYEKVGQVIFDDRMIEAVSQKIIHPGRFKLKTIGHQTPPIGKKSIHQGSTLASSEAAVARNPFPVGLPPCMVKLPVQSFLNPNVISWIPVTENSSNGQRSMFLTFSKGYPICRQEILEFFNTQYGLCVQAVNDQRFMFLTFSKGFQISWQEILEFFNTQYGLCVQAVMIERAKVGSQPMYGRIVFRNISTIALVLNGKSTANFVINGKLLWARMYVPRTNYKF